MKDKSAIINSAQKLASKGLIDGAIAEWEKLLSNGKDASIYNTIGDLYLRKGDNDNAVESFVKAAEIFREDGFSPKAIAIYKKILNVVPSEVHALAALAELNEEKGIFGNAAEHYRKAAETYFRNNDFQSAIGIYERIVKIIPNDMASKVKIAELFIKMGLNEKASNSYAAVATEYLEKNDVERANVFFGKALETDPGNACVFLGQSRLEEDSNNIPKAFELVSKAMSSDPGNADILTSFVRISQKAGKENEAKNTLISLISKDPANMDAKKFLGYMFLKEQDPGKAWEFLSPCIEDLVKEQKYPEAVNMLGHFRDMHPVDVRQQLIEIYRLQDDSEALVTELKELAAQYEKEGDREEALQLYREIHTLNPQDTEAFECINDLEHALGLTVPEEQPGIAEEAIETASAAPDEGQKPVIDLTPAPDDKGETVKSVEEEDYESFYTNGVELKEQGRLEEAIQAFQKAGQDPSRAMLSTRMIADCLMKQGAYTRAIGEFNKMMVSLSPADAGYINTKYELASAHMNNRDYNKSLELFEDIQSQEPGFRDVEDKIKELKSPKEQTQQAKPKRKKERISYI